MLHKLERKINMNILVIAAHPDIKQSRINKALTAELKDRTDVIVSDLYQEYPNWLIDVQKEQQLLQQADRIVFQFPFYWYSCPPLLKKWFDDVLTFGWAFGPVGEHLKGKEFIIATTTGGLEEAYRSGGDNGFTISELLRPIQTTILKCNGTFLPVFVTYNSHQSSDDQLAQEARRYATHILTPRPVLVHQ